MTRKLVGILLAVCILALGSAFADEKAYTIGVSAMNMANVHYIAETNAMLELAGKNNCELIVIDAANDIVKQLSDVEDLISRGCDAIIISAIDKDGIRTALDRCQEAGVFVLMSDMMISDSLMPLVAGYVGTDNEQAGRLCAEDIVVKSEGQAKVCVLERSASGNITARVKGVDAVLSACETVEIVARQDIMSTTEAAASAMEDILQAHPEITDVFCGNDLEAIGVSAVCEAAGRSDIRIYSVDGTEPCLKLISEGKQTGAVRQQPELIGTTCIELCLAYFADANVEIPEKSLMECVYINSDNVAQYYNP